MSFYINPVVSCLHSSCVEENTSDCLKEHGDCVCKSGFYGFNCERKCTGILKCDRPNICTCTLTIEQNIELLGRTQNGLTVGLVCSIVLLVCLTFLVCLYRIKTKNLKNQLKNFSLRYSSDRNEANFNNSIYSNILLDDLKLPLTNPPESQGNNKKSFLSFLTSMSKDWLEAKLDKNGSSQGNEEKNRTHTTIGDLKGVDNKGRNENDPMPANSKFVP